MMVDRVHHYVSRCQGRQQHRTQTWLGLRTPAVVLVLLTVLSLLLAVHGIEASRPAHRTRKQSLRTTVLLTLNKATNQANSF